MPDEKIALTAYSGHRGEEIPRSFILQSEKIEVLEILDRWAEENFETRGRKRFFKIRGSDGYVHKLYYDEREKAWFLSKVC
jgi:hypothetical protein